MARLLRIVALLCIEFCVLTTASAKKCSYAGNARVICQNVGALKSTDEKCATSAHQCISTPALGVVFAAVCCTDHCCGQAAQYCLMCTFTVRLHQCNNIVVLQVQPRVWHIERAGNSKLYVSIGSAVLVIMLLTRSCHCQMPAKNCCYIVILH